MKKTQSYFDKRKFCGNCGGTGFSTYKYNPVCIGCKGSGKYKKLEYKIGFSKNVINKLPSTF